MQIIRVEGNVKESRVDGVKVSNLPKGLQSRMVRLLNKLRGVKRINVEREVGDALFEISNKNVTSEHFNQKIRKEFLGTIGLLIWYLGRHWYSTGPEGVIGGPIYCEDCHHSEPSGHHGYCPIASCPSHKKWRMVIGPSYTPPEEDPDAGPFKNQVAHILPRTGGLKRSPFIILGPGGKGLPKDLNQRVTK